MKRTTTTKNITWKRLCKVKNNVLRSLYFTVETMIILLMSCWNSAVVFELGTIYKRYHLCKIHIIMTSFWCFWWVRRLFLTNFCNIFLWSNGGSIFIRKQFFSITIGCLIFLFVLLIWLNQCVLLIWLNQCI